MLNYKGLEKFPKAKTQFHYQYAENFCRVRASLGNCEKARVGLEECKQPFSSFSVLY